MTAAQNKAARRRIQQKYPRPAGDKKSVPASKKGGKK